MDASNTFDKRSPSSGVEIGDGVQNHHGNREPGTIARPANKQGTKNSPSASLLDRLYGPITQPLEAVERLLRKELQSPFEDVAALLRHGVNLGGKRLRPAIHLLLADALGEVTNNNVVIATVLEMVHTATLVHDDVLDNALTRRHVETVNAKWNNHTSILLGDYLFAQSFRLSATLDNTRTCQWVGEAARLVCEGELRQVLHRDWLELDEATYFAMIRGKTAELCRVACSLAAAEAGRNERDIEAIAAYGDHLGIAFQIADDYLDLWGDDGAVGKTLGTDLQQGKLTLPIIRLLETATSTVKQSVLEILSGAPDSRVDRIRPLLDKSDAKAYTANVAAEYRDRALAAIANLPEKDSRRCLTEIAYFSVDRTF
ncbi:polyprenyl synthetase family protein [Rhodopirellula sp. MGV]|uniref:polyprenyl synthetase family protein n=1 Tax=Rhodopirellula sp. MGV TaxID=2023130 RepID=UPI000B97A705|nr:polyprenyl synthetase family protein [Rhodopirellula sp. MGV]OYP36954.1 polyprenyl synthetase [Rhodopirellula sp. MGV]PNY36284.1 polyprenyl synthetase family protein [Rhodopirellula baltica]